MGWMGWTEAETLDTTMAGILSAYDGRTEMLNAIFGGGESKEKLPSTPAGKGSLRNAIRMLAGGRRKR